MKTPRLVIGSRGSRLARAQAQEVITALCGRIAAHIELRIIKTGGDRKGLPSAPGAKETGIFVKELEQALLTGKIDIAVHSLKDLPLSQPEGLELAACIRRADPRDVLVSIKRHSLSQLPEGATVGTGSPRRRAQLLHTRQDLKVVPIRGNVDTRISLVDSGKLDALVLAAAGLGRLGLAERGVAIPLEIMLPAPGQGVLALQTRADDAKPRQWGRCCDDEATRACVLAERAVLGALGGGCHAPLGAFAEMLEAGKMSLWVRLLSPGGKLRAEVKVTGSAGAPLELAKQAASEIKLKADSGPLPIMQ